MSNHSLPLLVEYVAHNAYVNQVIIRLVAIWSQCQMVKVVKRGLCVKKRLMMIIIMMMEEEEEDEKNWL